MPPHEGEVVGSTHQAPVNPTPVSAKVQKPARPAMNPENPLLPLGIVAAVGASFYVIDNYLADWVASYQYVPQIGLHNPLVPSVAVVLYLLMVFLLPRYMKDRKPLNLKGLMLVHNFFLSYLSLLMLVGIVREVAFIGFQGGYEAVACDSALAHPKTPLYFWYHVFYLSKMYEFIDTMILCLRKKQLIFLHVYHHIITLWLCWVTMDRYLSMQWLCSPANCLVHVFMYYFYGCQALNINIWWKKYLTSLQIVQFVLDELGNLSWAYYTVVEGRQCGGDWFSFWFGMFVLGSFLALFLQFFKKTYSGKEKDKDL